MEQSSAFDRALDELDHICTTEDTGTTAEPQLESSPDGYYESDAGKHTSVTIDDVTTPTANCRNSLKDEALDSGLASLTESTKVLKQRVKALIGSMDRRREVFESLFPGDFGMRRLFDQMLLRLRELGVVILRGSAKRCNLANIMLTPQLQIREPPKYSIQFEHDDGTEVVYLKRLMSGWCVKIDRPTFEKLAYGDANLPAKAYENLHMLIARGPVFQVGSFPSLFTDLVRIHFVVACDETSHLARNAACIERKKSADERAKCFGFLSGGATSTCSQSDALAQVKLMELNILFVPDSVVKDEAKPWPKHYTCVDMTPDECFEKVLELISSNLLCMAEAFEWALANSGYAEKGEYWGALRGSDATSQKLLINLFDACLGKGNTVGRPVGCEGARELCEQYQKDYAGLSSDDMATKLVQWQASLNVTTGFATGFGGFITMPITIPAGLLATWITSARLAFSVAHVYDHDIFNPCVADAVLYCLTGASKDEDKNTSEENVRSRLRDSKAARSKFSVQDCVNTMCDDAFLGHDLALEVLVPEEDCAQEGVDPCQGIAWYDPSSKEFHAPSSKEFQEEFKTLYDLLGVAHEATQQEIRIAYRRLALRHHPDKLRSSDPEQVRIATQRFQVLGAAYEELSDPKRRKAYDKTLHQGNWSWADFSWETGIERAQQAFMQARRSAAEALFQTSHHDISGHATSRAITQAAVEVVELSSVSALIRAGGTAEIRSSVIAGEKLAASATARSSSKLIPILGALISGVIDGATTASVGRCAIRIFKP